MHCASIGNEILPHITQYFHFSHFMIILIPHAPYDINFASQLVPTKATSGNGDVCPDSSGTVFRDKWR